MSKSVSDRNRAAISGQREEQRRWRRSAGDSSSQAARALGAASRAGRPIRRHALHPPLRCWRGRASSAASRASGRRRRRGRRATVSRSAGRRASPARRARRRGWRCAPTPAPWACGSDVARAARGTARALGSSARPGALPRRAARRQVAGELVEARLLRGRGEVLQPFPGGVGRARRGGRSPGSSRRRARRRATACPRPAAAAAPSPSGPACRRGCGSRNSPRFHGPVITIAKYPSANCW